MTFELLGVNVVLSLASLLWLAPAAAAVVIGVFRWPRWFAATIALVTMFGLVAAIAWKLGDFDPGAGVQSRQFEPWIAGLGINYHVGIDGLSLAMVGLTAFAFPWAAIYGLWARRSSPRAYLALLLVFESALMLLFVARDLVLFYVGFEAMLIPLLFLMIAWGGGGARLATMRFVIYTLVGSLLMLLSIITLGLHAGTFEIDRIGTSGSTWLFLGFLIAFAIKSPLYPFHGWVPGAYRESPAEVAGLLSAIASKAGAYGLLRFVLPIFPGPVADWQMVLIVLALGGLLWASLVAFRQPDSRGVIAYSSIAQMSLIALGIFALKEIGSTGATFQMVNHGLLSLLLFLVAGFVEVRYGTGVFRKLGQLARNRAALATICIVTGIMALAVPGSALFASEFLVLLGAYQEHWLVGVVASLAIVLAAMYMLRWISAVLHDAATEAEPVPHVDGPPPRRTRTDVRWEALYLVPIIAGVLALSAYPAFVTDRVDAAVTKLTVPAAVESAR